MPASDVRLILCSDIHLSDHAPIFRSTEPDWFEAMARPLRELGDAADHYGVPIVIAGDVFHKWNSSPALINFALDELPNAYAIPGQHDLPHHRYEDIEQSAYWTLVKAGKLINLEPDKPIEVNGIVLHGFPWNAQLKPCEEGDLCLHLAVVHKYIWSDPSDSYPGANSADHIAGWIIRQLTGFDAMVFGDNHKGFLINKTEAQPPILNSGGFMKRSKDDADRVPSFGLLHGDGTIERWAVNCKQDKCLEQEEHGLTAEPVDADLLEFISQLQQLGDDSLDFEAAVRRYCRDNDVDEETTAIVMEIFPQ